MDEASKQILIGVLRHALTSWGAVLVSRGYLSSGSLEELVGALIVIGSVLWSSLHKQAVHAEISELRQNCQTPKPVDVTTTNPTPNP